MTDLEMLKLCAMASELEFSFDNHPHGIVVKEDLGTFSHLGEEDHIYDPFKNDAQAMALVKKFEMHISRNPGTWWCMPADPFYEGLDGPDCEDLNRAIVQCAANIWKEKIDRENIPTAS